MKRVLWNTISLPLPTKGRRRMVRIKEISLCGWRTQYKRLASFLCWSSLRISKGMICPNKPKPSYRPCWLLSRPKTCTENSNSLLQWYDRSKSWRQGHGNNVCLLLLAVGHLLFLGCSWLPGQRAYHVLPEFISTKTPERRGLLSSEPEPGTQSKWHGQSHTAYRRQSRNSNLSGWASRSMLLTSMLWWTSTSHRVTGNTLTTDREGLKISQGQQGTFLRGGRGR